MSNPKAPTITPKEWAIVGGTAAAFLILAIIAFAGGFFTMVIILPLLAILLPVAVVALAIWLLYKFGFIIVRDGILAADAARRAQAVVAPPE